MEGQTPVSAGFNAWADQMELHHAALLYPHRHRAAILDARELHRALLSRHRSAQGKFPWHAAPINWDRLHPWPPVYQGMIKVLERMVCTRTYQYALESKSESKSESQSQAHGTSPSQPDLDFLSRYMSSSSQLLDEPDP